MTIPDFRPKYRELSPAEQKHLDDIKLEAHTMAVRIQGDASMPKDPRCIALAMTKLEECVMWAVKAYTAPIDPFQKQAVRDERLLILGEFDRRFPGAMRPKEINEGYADVDWVLSHFREWLRARAHDDSAGT